MKTRTKTLAVVEIAILMCSMFLVTLPTIAADQITQKVGASTSEVTTASEDDFTLRIYGNANEDDAIDMRDTTYIKLVIFNKKPETKLADANNDGKVSMLDVGQTKLIILGKEREITLVDSADRIVTVKKPLNRIVVIGTGPVVEAIRALKATEKVVGVDDYVVIQQKVYFPELSKVTSIGSWSNPDMEKIIELNPDLVMVYGASLIEKLGPVIDAGVTVACFGLIMLEDSQSVTKLGYTLDKEEEAKEFNDFIQEGKAGITELVKDIPEDDKPLVYVETSWAYHTTITTYPGEVCILAGGRLITADLLDRGSNCEVEPEWVVKQNPDVIIRMVPTVGGGEKGGILTDNPSAMKEIRDEIMNRPELANVKAVKNERVYVMSCKPLVCTPAYCNGIAYMAKAFYPDLLKDLDHRALLQQFITEFQGLDFDVYEHGVFIYPPL